MGAGWPCRLELVSNRSLDPAGLSLPLSPPLVASSPSLDLRCCQRSLHHVSLVVQGCIPRLIGHDRHWGHVLYELGPWRGWLGQSLRRRSAMTHGQRRHNLSHSHVVNGVIGIVSKSCSHVQFNPGVHRTQAQLPTAPDSAPPAVAGSHQNACALTSRHPAGWPLGA